MSTKIRIEDIAKVCHQANKAYCEMLGDHTQQEWEAAPEWQRVSAINGVKAHIASGFMMSGIDSHISWMNEKVATGWSYGPVKDPDNKTHPCLVPYHQLPIEQRVKDSIFTAIVRAIGRDLPPAMDEIHAQDAHVEAN